MSLNKQLWLAIVFTLILACGGSFILSTLSSKNMLEQQLQMKNIDNVTSLALSMSQMKKDPVVIDLLLSAQFDSGHYEYIGLFDPNGKLISERVNANSSTKAPKWFVKLIPIKVQAGVANIQNGWLQYGSLKLESDSKFAYDKLWDETLLIALWALLIGLLSCYAGSQILRKILSPLKDVVDQAKAIGDHRFITINAPKTEEFKAVADAMNSLSNRIKKTVSEESTRLEDLRLLNNFDHITGLIKHDYFESKVDASISHEEYFSEGVLIVSRLSNLATIDQSLGYLATNDLLRRIGDALENECKNQPALFAGRLNGTDFAIFSNQPIDGFTLGSQIQNTLAKSTESRDKLLNGNFITAAIQVTKSDTASKLIGLVDSILDEISINNSNILHVINQSDVEKHQNYDQNEWQRLLTSALDHKRIKLELYPVNNHAGELIHNESPVRLQLIPDGKWFCAGEFITWANQLNLISRVDELVLETALDLLSKGAEPIGLNISASAMCNRSFVETTINLIKQNSSLAQHLYFEIPEQGAFDHLVEFRHFCNQLKALGCKVGIEHVGSRISRLGELHDVGLDYIKIDVSVIRGIDTNEANKTLLRGLCMIAHSIGVLAIAEGVQTHDEYASLQQIGIDGMTGPGIKSSGF